MPTLTTRQKRAAADRRRAWKVVLALLAALALHAILLPIIVLVAAHWPKSHLHGVAPSPLRLTILPPTRATPAPDATGQKPDYMRTTAEQEAKEKPKDPNFISDKDTLAASEKPADGDKPLPSQDGRKSDDFDFDTTNYRPGKEASEAASDAPAVPTQTQTQAPQPTPPPEPKATPPPNKARAKRKTSAAAATPTPNGELATSTPEPSAPPEPPVPTPEKEDETGNAPPRPTQEQTRSQPNQRNNPSLVPNPGLQRPPGYQPQTRQTMATGSINNRGRSAVQAMGTPLGRYIKNVQDSIGALWYLRVNDKMDVLSTGDVKLHFYVDRSGRAKQVRVISGDGNSALASVSTGAVMEADIPPIPPEVLETLSGEQMEMELGFDMY